MKEVTQLFFSLIAIKAPHIHQYLRDLGVRQSFSEPGVPYDNSVVESFFSFMKKEEIHRNIYETVE